MSIETSYTPRFLAPEILAQVKIVGLSGEAGSGKSTMAKFLVREYGFSPISLANPFKLDGIMLEGLPIEEVFGSHKSDYTRKWLQERGTEYGRKVAGEDVWVNYLEANIYYLIDHGVDRVVIPDTRFPNEVDAVSVLGGVVYRIEGRGGAAGDRAKHASERALDGFDGYTRYLDNSPENKDEVFEDLSEYLGEDLGVYPVIRL